MPKLVKTELAPLTKQRVIRMMQDTLTLAKLSPAEVRAIYSELETVRDALSALLDRVDGKHV